MSSTILDRVTDARSDEDLVEATRGGDRDAYAVLWERHSESGRRAARAVTSSFDPDDVVSEAFAATLNAIRNGGGPRGPFRPYLFAAVRNVTATWGTKSRELPLDDIGEFSFEAADTSQEDFADRTLLVAAFRQLPERWRTLLWYMEVEGLKPREIAPLMGLTANGVSALAVRARQGFAQAWLAAHVADVDRPAECRWVCERIVRHGRKPAPRAARGRFDRHLRTCEACTIVARDLETETSKLRAVLLPLVLGGAGAAAYSVMESGAPAAAAVTGAGGSLTGVARASHGTTILTVAGTVVAVGIAGALAVAVTLGAASAARPVDARPAPIAPATPGDLVVEAVGPVEAPSASTDPPGPPPLIVAPESPVAPEAPGAPPAPMTPAAPEPPAEAPVPPASPSPPTTAPVPPEPTPVPPVAPPSPVVVPLTLATLDFAAPVPPVLEGTGTPGATVRVVDETGAVLVQAVVAADGSYCADVSGDLLHDGMTLRVEQMRPDAATSESTAPTGPFTFPVPSPARGQKWPAPVVDADADGAVDDATIELNGIAGQWVQLRVDGEHVGDALLTTDTTAVALTGLDHGSHTLTLRYLDPATGRTGLAVDVHLVVSAAG